MLTPLQLVDRPVTETFRLGLKKVVVSTSSPGNCVYEVEISLPFKQPKRGIFYVPLSDSRDHSKSAQEASLFCVKLRGRTPSVLAQIVRDTKFSDSPAE